MYKTVFQRYPLAAYFRVAYAITWGGILLIAGLKGFDPRNITLAEGVLMFFAMVLGPSLSSLLLTGALEGRAGVRALFARMTAWRVGWKAYLPLAIVPLLSATIFLTLSKRVSPAYTPNFNILFGLFIGGLAGFFEESGWTGFALPRLLQRHSALISGLILGLLWAVWHGMADFWGNFASYGSLWAPYFILYWILPLTAYRILMAYVYKRTGSLLLGQLMHLCYTGTLVTLSPAGLTPLQGFVWQPFFAVGLWAIVAVVVVKGEPGGLRAGGRRLVSPLGLLIITALFGGLYLGALHPWMSRWGASAAEAAMPLPGDDAKAGVVITSTRAVTIQAPANEVWRWVVQLGQERAGFYSNDWLENLALADIHNAGELRPEWQQRALGDHVLGAGGPVYGADQFWEIPYYEEGRALYLWGTIVVQPVDANTSRLLVRSYTPPPGALVGVISAFSYDWMHFVMERGMLLGIQARAEGRPETPALLRLLAGSGWALAGAGLVYVLFARRRGWWWGLLPLAYGAAILYLTGDGWSALAGFLWWGVITAGFVVWGRAWRPGLLLAILAVILVYVLADQPHTAFGVIFLALALMAVASTFSPRRRAARRGVTSTVKIASAD
jgi:membrane protease YdiL (CAAX protease family)